MTQLYKDPNAKRGTHRDKLLENLNGMNASLEGIQRSLDMYLETKRQFFPRFYFLSNDDLLEILGQSKNPEAVSRKTDKDHLIEIKKKKLFGITLKLLCQIINIIVI